MAIIQLQNVNKQYYSGEQLFHALADINLTIARGELLAIMGPSGSGKSTLMNVIGLLDRPDHGDYFLNQQSVNQLSDDQRADCRNHTIGFVFQQFYLLPRLTAAQNVALPLTYRQSSKSDIEQRVSSLLADVGMSDRAHHRPNQLSGGQQQRVALARALVGNPDIILADEPTGALDSKTSQEVMQLLIDLNQQQQKTIIIVTHDPHIGQLCHRQIHLRDGKIEI